MSNTGYIYKLVCKDIEIKECYVGSTKNFRTRKFDHKSRSNNYSNNPNFNAYVYRFIRANGGWPNWDMIQVEEYKYTTKRDLLARERYWIEELKSSLNKIVPITTTTSKYEYDQEYYQANKQKKQKQIKEYHKNNKIQIKRYMKEYYQNSPKVECDCGSSFRMYNKSYHLKTKKNQQYQELYDFIYS